MRSNRYVNCVAVLPVVLAGFAGTVSAARLALWNPSADAAAPGRRQTGAALGARGAARAAAVVRGSGVALTLFLVVSLAAGAQNMALPEPVGMQGDPAARIVLDGNAAFLRGDLDAAARDYRAALARKPNFAVAFFNLGLVEAHQGRRMRGLRDMDRGIDLAATHGMSAGYVGRLRSLRAAFAQAPVAT